MLEYILALKAAPAVTSFTPPAVVAGKAFQGWVASADLINGPGLASSIGLAGGTPHNDDAGWLHYIDGSREFYIARTTLRYGLSAAMIEAAIAGNKTILIGTNYYQVKQLTSMSQDPFTSIVSNPGGGDWDKYIYPLVAGPARAQISAEIWSYYTETDLGLSPIWGTQPNGSISITVEKHNTLVNARAARGRNYSGGTTVSSVTGRTVWYPENPTEGNAGTGINQYGWRPILEKVPQPPEPDAYLGEVTSANFITAAALTTAVGMDSEGAVTNADVSWLKYKLKGKTVYLAKKPLRHGVAWSVLNGLGAVFGTKTVVIGGLTYKVRLMTGGNSGTPPINSSGAGGEFNDMVYPVTGGASAGQPAVLAYPRWAAFTDLEMGWSTTKSPIPNGALALCQEPTTSGGHLVRGYNDADNVGNAQLLAGWYIIDTPRQLYTGWRPVLELVP